MKQVHKINKEVVILRNKVKYLNKMLDLAVNAISAISDCSNKETDGIIREYFLDVDKIKK